MKEALSSLDISAAVKELQAIIGGHVDKVYHPSLEHLVLAVRRPGEGKVFLHFVVGRWLYISDEGGEMPAQPSDFAMMLRKRILNARITGVRQQGFDRIVVLTLDKDGAFELVLESFGDGNVILVANGEIVQPLTSHTWKHRDVRAKRPFAYPPPVPNPFGMVSDDLLAILKSSNTDIVRTLATKLNMGGVYSEEVCARSGIDKKSSAADIGPDEVERILGCIHSLMDEILESGKGFVVLKDGVVMDAVPTRLKVHEGLEHEEHPSFSDAIRSYIPRMPVQKAEKKRDSVLELERIKRKIAQQEAAVIRLQDEARESQNTGDFIYSRYAEADDIIKAARAAAEHRDIENIPGYKSFDRKQRTLTIAMGGSSIELEVDGTVESSSRRYYEAAKKARKKLDGVLAALSETRRSLDSAETEGEREPESRKRRHEPTKRFWFERYRWFISSEGAIVLGGKDAKSNDLLVKKHLKPGDRYAHADMHGAPSVVVKVQEGVTDKTLYEACEFAVATSKAWNAKIGSAAGYWVMPEQVSKTPQSGEYLAKGAFVIRGKRNYSNKLDIKLGIGETEFENARKIMCGPESAVRSRCERYVVFRPGKKNKNDFAKMLADMFEVPIEEIQSVLPPGDVDVIDQVGVPTSS
jgi:predicted ribosome quality control (RQC) complex YloA/Tae2 family protein